MTERFTRQGSRCAARQPTPLRQPAARWATPARSSQLAGIDLDAIEFNFDWRRDEDPEPTDAASSTASAYDWLTELLEAVGSGDNGGGTYRGQRTSAYQCPSHDDSNPSLQVTERENGSVRLTCWGGCERDDVLDALKLRRSHLKLPPDRTPSEHAELVEIEFPPKTSGAGSSASGHNVRRSRPDGMHYYTRTVRLERRRDAISGSKRPGWQYGQLRPIHYFYDAEGHLGVTEEQLFSRDAQVTARLVIKADHWQNSRGSVSIAKLPIYNQHDVLGAMGMGEIIVLCESESSADALNHAATWATHRWTACTWAGGASAVPIAKLKKLLSGKKGVYPKLVVIADNDKAGLACLAKLQREGLAPAWIVPENHTTVRQDAHGVIEYQRQSGSDAKDLLVRLGWQWFEQRLLQALDGTCAPEQDQPVGYVPPPPRLRESYSTDTMRNHPPMVGLGKGGFWKGYPTIRAVYQNRELVYTNHEERDVWWVAKGGREVWKSYFGYSWPPADHPDTEGPFPSRERALRGAVPHHRKRNF